MLEAILSHVAQYWHVILPVALVAFLAGNYFNHGLNKYPGPFLASLSNVWRFVDVWNRRPDITHIALHRKHGDVVRLGPNVLSFSDPAAIKQIYGLNKGFVKVRRTHSAVDLANGRSLDSTHHSKQSHKANDCRLFSQPPTKPIMQIFDAQ